MSHLSAALRRLNRAFRMFARPWLARISPIVTVIYSTSAIDEATARSVLAQTYWRYELLIIADQEMSSLQDPRIRYFRNASDLKVRGAFVLHLQDNVHLTPDNLEILTRRIASSRSDLVVGVTKTLIGGRRISRPGYGKTHRENARGINLDQVPELIVHNQMSAMLFRKSFWSTLCVPASVDLVEIALTAFLTATRIDVECSTVALAAQSRSNLAADSEALANAFDELEAQCTAALQAFNRHPNRVAKLRWTSFHLVSEGLKKLGADLDFQNDEMLERWANLFRLFLDSHDWESPIPASVYRRAIAWSLANDRFDEARALRKSERLNLGRYATNIVHGTVIAQLPHSAVPLTLRTLTTAETPLKCRVHRLSWAGSVLSTTGWAYIHRVGRINAVDHTQVYLVNGEHEIPMEVSPQADLEVTRQQSDPFGDYEDSGFNARLDVSKIPENFADTQDWSIEVRVNIDGVERHRTLKRTGLPDGSSLSGEWTVGNDQYVGLATWNPSELTIRTRKIDVRVDRTELTSTHISFFGRTFGEKDFDLRLGEHLATVVRSTEDDGSFTATILLPKSEKGRELELRGFTGSEEFTVHLAPEVTQMELNSGWQLASNHLGNASLCPIDTEIFIQSFKVTHEEFQVLYSTANTDVSRVVLLGKDSEIEAEVNQNGTSASAHMILRHKLHTESHPIPVGDYKLEFHSSTGAKIATRLTPHVLDSLPLNCNADVPETLANLPYRVRANKARSLTLRAVPQRVSDEGPSRQHTLISEIYPKLRTTSPLKDAVLFESSRGRIPGCNPAAILAELQSRSSNLEMLWAVNDMSIPVPPNCRPIVRLSSEYFDALATSKYLVNNNFFPKTVERRIDQVHLQTWHGTPLKKIGHDTPRNVFSNRAYAQWIDAEARSWSYLISPNRYTSEILPRAFNYDGPILETGYPRNDALVNNSAELSARARAWLNIPQDSKVILYAPTWRDDQFHGKVENVQAVTYLDNNALIQSLPDDYYVVFRGHVNTLLHGGRLSGKRFIDATRYPDITDLYCLADILITDYSSVMFDFAVTGKPQIFLTPDLVDYRDRLRGFYFEFAADAPGPLTTSTSEVIDNVKAIDEVSRTYGPAYQRFKQRFCSLEDGNASARVVDSVFGADL